MTRPVVLPETSETAFRCGTYAEQPSIHRAASSREPYPKEPRSIFEYIAWTIILVPIALFAGFAFLVVIGPFLCIGAAIQLADRVREDQEWIPATLMMTGIIWGGLVLLKWMGG